MEDKKVDTKVRGSHWAVTCYNGDIDTFEGWVNGGPRPTWLRACKGQREECPSTKRVHIQGQLDTVQVRFHAIKEALPDSHIEKVRKLIAHKQYVQKADTCIGPKLDMKVDGFVSVPAVLDMLGDILYKKKEEWIAKGVVDQSEWFDLAGSYLLEDRYDLIGLISQPQVQRAFNKWYHVLYKRAEERANSVAISSADL